MSLKLINTVQKLETFMNSSAPILSIYLEVPKSQPPLEKPLLKIFADLVSISLDPSEQEIFTHEISSIEGFLQQYQNDNYDQSLAFFVGGNNLWEVIHLQDKIATSLVISHSPNLIPIHSILKKFGHYLIILVDREKAKFFTLSNGEVEEQKTVIDKSVPQKIHTGEAGSRQNKVDHHFQELLNKHLDTIMKDLDIFMNNKPVNGVIIGGHKTLIHQIEKHLPKHLQNKILGEFVSELNISNEDIFQHCRKLLESLNLPVPQRHFAKLLTAK